MSGNKGMQHYPLEVKLEAVRMFYEEGKTQPEIAEILGIRNAQRVKDLGAAISPGRGSGV